VIVIIKAIFPHLFVLKRAKIHARARVQSSARLSRGIPSPPSLISSSFQPVRVGGSRHSASACRLSAVRPVAPASAASATSPPCKRRVWAPQNRCCCFYQYCPSLMSQAQHCAQQGPALWSRQPPLHSDTPPHEDNGREPPPPGRLRLAGQSFPALLAASRQLPTSPPSGAASSRVPLASLCPTHARALSLSLSLLRARAALFAEVGELGTSRLPPEAASRCTAT